MVFKSWPLLKGLLEDLEWNNGKLIFFLHLALVDGFSKGHCVYAIER